MFCLIPDTRYLTPILMEERYSETYNAPSLPPTPVTPPPGQYVGNGKDMTAFLAMLAGVGMLATTCVPGLGCLLPFFALIGGIVALCGANQALDPSRTRTYAWLAIGAGAVFIVLGAALIALYGAFIFAFVQEAQIQNFGQ